MFLLFGTFVLNEQFHNHLQSICHAFQHNTEQLDYNMDWHLLIKLGQTFQKQRMKLNLAIRSFRELGPRKL